MMVQMRNRIEKLLEYLQAMIYPERMAIEEYRTAEAKQELLPGDMDKLDGLEWHPFSRTMHWGGDCTYRLFATEVVVPVSFAGKCIVYEVRTGREGSWDATNPQFSCFVDGVRRQGLDVNHREVLLAEQAEAGRTYRIVLLAYTGNDNPSLVLDTSLKVLDRKTERYWYDVSVPFGVAKLLPDEDLHCITILKALNDSLNLLDLRHEGSPAYHRSLEKAQEALEHDFYERYCGRSDASVFCVGHTHIDCAWLWTLQVAKEKAVRSFSTVLELMKQYPEYLFMASQPQLYAYVKQASPELFAAIKERVAEGRWEPEGGMFVEADCNLASGESLVRQFMHGQQFFKDEFGKDNEILWLPDTFGYSAALPQIMRKCGLRYFMTTKISWNEFNAFPYDTFVWEGLDGSKVLTHLIPTSDLQKTSTESYESNHFTTYNGYLAPNQIMGGWAKYRQKELNREVLCSFGFGDGGGGPTRDMLENQRRLARGIPGCPKTVMSTAGDFFRMLDKEVSGSRELPLWVGELYLEYHRGTYTGMARNKNYNRRAEFACENAECFSMMASCLVGRPYRETALHEDWEIVLRNQFHDILPGSAIKEVYDESRKEYETLLSRTEEDVKESLEAIASRVKTKGTSVVVFNPNGMDGDGIVSVQLPESLQNLKVAVFDGHRRLPIQDVGNTVHLFVAPTVPSKGYRTFALQDDCPEMAVVPAMVVDKRHMENTFFSIDFNEKGQFSSLYDKREGREILQEGQAGNVLVAYEDRPHDFDGWNLDASYTEKSWEIDGIDDLAVIENGPVRSCVRIARSYQDSSIIQYVYLYASVPRIDIKTEIDWKEHQTFVKALYPVDIHTDEATFEVQYGNVKRATHANTSWDLAKFEVCVHKWLDVSEAGYGVGFLNDCKYGCSVKNGIVGLSLLKSGIFPNPEADQERHVFCHSIYPHQGGWRDSSLVGEAYLLNNPMRCVVKEQGGGDLPERYSLVSCDQKHVVIEVVKKAMGGSEMVLRLYECHNRRGPVTLTFAEPLASIVECDMMEQGDVPITHEGNRATFTIMPYEIKTCKVSFR